MHSKVSFAETAESACVPCDNSGTAPHAATFSLVDTFDIDNGELDGLSPEQAFALGVEWAEFRRRLDEGAEFSQPVHCANASRLLGLVGSRGMYAEYFPGDEAHGHIVVLKEPPGGGGRLPRRLRHGPDDGAVRSARRERVALAERDLTASAVGRVDTGLLTLLACAASHSFSPVGLDPAPWGQSPPPFSTGRRSLPDSVAGGSDIPGRADV